MADNEPFTLIEEHNPSPTRLFNQVITNESGKTADHDLQYITHLRRTNPDTIITAIPEENSPLRLFAAAGHATCERDTETDSFYSWRGYVPPRSRQEKGGLGEQVHFAKFRYEWGQESFLLYVVMGMQYVLASPADGEDLLGPSGVTDSLIKAVGDWIGSEQQIVWVYDLYWQRSRELYLEVIKASWGKVILDEGMKRELTGVAKKFFDSKEVYEDLGVPWKRGLLFHGSPGNGKTISIKALMHTLLDFPSPIPTLYVKSAPRTYDIRNVFAQARRLAPCMMVLEDVETIVTPDTRSYFFNEMDGLSNNSGIFVVASTNFLDRLDPGLSKRPSRFDRKYLFPLPNEHERVLYCEFWRSKLQGKKSARVDFPSKLCPPMAKITGGFSFAFMQEAFVASLLAIARKDDADDRVAEHRDLEDYELWRVFRQEVNLLRKEVDGSSPPEAAAMANSNSRNEGLTHGCSCSGPHAVPNASSDRRLEWEDMLAGKMRDLQMEDKVLPELPYPQKEHYEVNTKAIMATIG